MSTYFSELANLEHRALQVYLILIGAAHNRQILTYKIVSDLIGYDGPGVISRQLGHIMFWCIEEDFPALTSIVVNSKAGLPGDGLVGQDYNAEREKVYGFNWYDIVPPSVDALKAAYDRGRSSGGAK